VTFSSLLSAGPAAPLTGDDDDRAYLRDLNLDQIVAAVARDHEEHDLIATVLNTRLHEAGAVRYRQAIFQDLEDSGPAEAVRRFSTLMSRVRRHLHQLEQMRYPLQREGWRLDAAAIYCDAVSSLATQLASARLSSRGLLALRDDLASFTGSDTFTGLARATKACQDALGKIRYCVNIRGDRVEVSHYDGEADYSAAVLSTFDRFKQGAAKDYRINFRVEPGMDHITHQIAELVARLFPDEFTALHDYNQQHAAFLDEGIRQAHSELQFYLAYLDYIAPVRRAGLQFCYPEVSDSGQDSYGADVFDLALARKLAMPGRPVVTNDFALHGPERIIVVTGPNQGGKTTFARTFGQLHHLASIGVPVPGRAARLLLPDRILTHFEKEENLAAMTGKLEDELIRIGHVLQAATPASVVILNETFASTTVHDARFLGTRFLTRLIQLGSLGVYVTFIDELATLGEQIVSMMSTIVPGNPAERTFKVIRKPADGRAYARAIAEKYGVTYEQLHARLTA
jgi:DNA mismatch repair protein MutS